MCASGGGIRRTLDRHRGWTRYWRLERQELEKCEVMGVMYLDCRLQDVRGSEIEVVESRSGG